MGKSKEAAILPLEKRPIVEIVQIATEAGRVAFTRKETIDNVWQAVRNEWLTRMLAGGHGMPDDDFNLVMEKASDAFEEGVDEYVSDLLFGRAPPDPDTVAALEREVKDEQFQVTCAQEIFVWLGGIFRAIERAADACPDMRSRGEIKRLAGCGNYLATDRADMLSDYAVPDDGGDHA